MTIYVFDMDGTLTPARSKMEASFALLFNTWQQTHICFIASGSDYKKITGQMPPFVISSFAGIYSSMGNVLNTPKGISYKKDFTPKQELLQTLENYRKNTLYPGKLYNNYIEKRIGMVNFSVLGRDCPFAEREKYAAWDKKANERQNIKQALQASFPEYEISVGGAISVDITKKGCGKGQIAYHLRQQYKGEKIIFFGDKTFPGGNDYELAETLRKLGNSEIIEVNSPKDVLTYLTEVEYAAV